MNKLFILPLLSLLILSGAACGKKATTNTNMTNTNEPVSTVLPTDQITGKQARIETNKGTIVIELFASEAPITVSNFVSLANKGYFNGLSFHRYVAGFVIQGGDPSGDGTGGPGYTIKDEPVSRNYDKGIVAMAKTNQPDSAGSQFFIMLENDDTLPKVYAIFGQVKSGQDVVDQLRAGDTMTKVTIEPVDKT